MTPQPRRLVLLGHPVAHSLSPRMQTAALRAAGIDATYEALDVPPDALEDEVARLAAHGAAGNVTIPHKARVAEICARRTPLAERTGAVNTFWTEHGEIVGDNTDVAGFDDAAIALLGALPANAEVALFGAGGAAAGILAAIERWQSPRVRLYNRTSRRAQTLAAQFASVAVVAESAAGALRGATLVVNATSVGLHDDDLPFPLERLPPGAAVLDLVYRAGDTRLVQDARSRGHAAAGGLAMLVGQGARAFERWFGVAANRQVMWEAVTSER